MAAHVGRKVAHIVVHSMHSQTETIQIHDISIRLTWKSGVRMMRVRVLPPDGIVCATAPRWTSRKAVIEFLSERYNWMQKAIHKVQSLPQPASHNYSEGEQVLLFGITYSLHIQEVKPKEKAFVSIDGSIITLHINPDSSQKKREMLLHAFYKERLSMVVSVYMSDYQSKLKCNPIPFRILHRKSVWGTFNPRKRSIVFNINLAQVPLECVQYVVLHEMTHQYVPAHNADFYNKMAVFMPDWKERRTRLKQFGHQF